MLSNAFSQVLFYKPSGKFTNYLISITVVVVVIIIELLGVGFDSTFLGLLFWLYLAVLSSALIGGLYSGLSSIVFSLIFVLSYSLIKVPLRSSSTQEIQTLVFILISLITTYIINAVKSTYQITISILDSLQTFTIILSPGGFIVDVNQAVLHAFGLKRATLIGRPFLSDLGIQYSADARSRIRNAIVQGREGRNTRFDLRLTMPNRSVLFVDFSLSPIYDRQCNVISLVVSGTDSTDRILTEKKIRKLDYTLQQRKDEFIALASHELKTPLTSLKVFAQLLQRSTANSKSTKNQEYVQKINRQIDRLSALVAELLDVSKIEAGQLQLQLEEFDLDQVVKESVSEIEASSEHHHFVISGSIQSLILGDVFRIKQVLLNLLHNAVKYSPHAPKINIQILDEKTQVVIVISDQGVGIPQPDQKRIFEKFFRAGGNNTHSFPGLGLGLYVSKRIIERHRGTIWLESSEGKGSSFSFSLNKNEKKHR